MNLQDTIAAAFEDLFPKGYPERLGIAVSGGGDSVALLGLALDWAHGQGVNIMVATVDHGLRPEAGKEAALVSKMCHDLGVPHETLKWQGWDNSGNLQDAARKARIDLIGNWARANRITDVATAHTLDDQAETVLMRLGRGSGVDGLSGIPVSRQHANIRWIRPLLETGREDLREYLRVNGVRWVEDRSNDDPRFERVKIRRTMGGLASIGITPQGLADTARRMTTVRRILDQETQNAAKKIAKTAYGDVFLKNDALFRIPAETRRRLLNHALNWVSGAEHSPRSASLTALETSLLSGKPATLHGCHISIEAGNVIITREYNAVSVTVCKTTEIWDGRWLVSGLPGSGFQVRALGEAGLKSCPDWRISGQTRTSLLATPAIWDDDELVAAPPAGFSKEWHIELIHDDNHFISTILSH